MRTILYLKKQRHGLYVQLKELSFCQFYFKVIEINHSGELSLILTASYSANGVLPYRKNKKRLFLHVLHDLHASQYNSLTEVATFVFFFLKHDYKLVRIKYDSNKHCVCCLSEIWMEFLPQDA